MIHLRFGDVELQPCSDMSSSSKSSSVFKSTWTESRDLCVGCYSLVMLQPGLATNSTCFRAFVGNFFLKLILGKVNRKAFELVTSSVLTTGLGGLTETVPKLGGSGGGPGVLGGWGLGNVCLLQMHSNAILGPHPGPSPELTKSPGEELSEACSRDRDVLRDTWTEECLPQVWPLTHFFLFPFCKQVKPGFTTTSHSQSIPGPK